MNYTRSPGAMRAASRSPRAATAATTDRSSARWSAIASSWSRSPTSRSSRSRCARATPCRPARRCCDRSSARCRRVSTRPSRRATSRSVGSRSWSRVRVRRRSPRRALRSNPRTARSRPKSTSISACRTSSTRKLLSQSALDQARARRDSAAGAQQASGCAPASAARRHAGRGSRAGRSGAQAGAGGPRRTADERGALRRQGAAGRARRSHSVQARRAAGRWHAADRDARGRHAVRARLRARTAAHAVPAGHADARRVSMVATRRCNGVVRFVSAEAAFTPYYALTQEDRSRLCAISRRSTWTRAPPPNVPTGMPVQVELRPTKQMSARPEDGPAISARNLTRRFGKLTAVDHVTSRHPARDDLRLPRAERLGQVDDDPHAVRPAAAERRRVRGPRPSGAARSRAAAHEDRLHDAALLAVGGPHGPGEPRLHRPHLRPRRQAARRAHRRAARASTASTIGASSAPAR